MKKPTRFERLVERVQRKDGNIGCISSNEVIKLLRREHRAIVRKVMGMRNKDCKDKHYFYLLACDQILDWMEARGT